MRNRLVYVLMNFRKRRADEAGDSTRVLDRYSSALWLDGEHARARGRCSGMLDVVRWIWAVLWALFFLGTWLTNLATLVRRAGSMIVLVGGVAGIVSIAIAPVRVASWTWPIPLLVDPGSSLVLLALAARCIRPP